MIVNGSCWRGCLFVLLTFSLYAFLQLFYWMQYFTIYNRVYAPSWLTAQKVLKKKQQQKKNNNKLLVSHFKFSWYNNKKCRHCSFLFVVDILYTENGNRIMKMRWHLNALFYIFTEVKSLHFTKLTSIQHSILLENIFTKVIQAA